MASVELPFEYKPLDFDGDQHDLMRCGLYQLMPADAKKYVDNSRHVLMYMHMIPLDQIGTPKLYTTLSRKLKAVKNPNLIYSINEDIAVHICTDKEDSRNYYIPIEPVLFANLSGLMDEVETKISRLVDKYKEPKTDEERKYILAKCIDDVCKINLALKRDFSRKPSSHI